MQAQSIEWQTAKLMRDVDRLRQQISLVQPRDHARPNPHTYAQDIYGVFTNIWGDDGLPIEDRKGLIVVWLRWRPPQNEFVGDFYVHIILTCLSNLHLPLELSVANDDFDPSFIILQLVRRYPQALLYSGKILGHRTVFHQLANMASGDLFQQILHHVQQSDDLANETYLQHLRSLSLQSKTPLVLAIERLDYGDEWSTLRMVEEILITLSTVLPTDVDSKSLESVFKDRGQDVPAEERQRWLHRQRSIVYLLHKHQHDCISPEIVEKVALAEDPDWKLVDMLFEARASRLHESDLLHKAVQKLRSPLVEKLLLKVPILATSTDAQNKYPMHYVCMCTDLEAKEDMRKSILSRVVRCGGDLQSIRRMLCHTEGTWRILSQAD